MSAEVSAAARAIRHAEARLDDAGAWQEATEIGLAWLLKQPDSHWYCARAQRPDDDHDDRHNVLVFLLRLLMFKQKGDVKTFRDRLSKCLDTCTDCVDGFLAAKAEYEKSWLIYATSQREVEAFTQTFAQRERERLTQLCDEAGLLASEATNPLSQLPDGVIHYMLSMPVFFESDDILPILMAACQKNASRVRGLPAIASAGLLSFAIHPDSALRRFAQAQLQQCEPMLLKQLKSLNRDHAVVQLLQRALGKESPGAHLLLTESEELWRGLEAMVGALDSDALTYSIEGSKTKARDGIVPSSLLRYVCSHLGDRDSHTLPTLLRLWTALLARSGARMWDEEDVDYAEVVLSSLLDNPAFEVVLRGPGASPDRRVIDLDADADAEDEPPDPALFSWLQPYMRSVSHSSQLFASSLGTIALVLFDRLQGARFSETSRAAAALAGLDLFRVVFLPKDETLREWPHAEAARSSVLDVYAGILSELAFGKAAIKARGKMAKIAAASAFFLQGVCERDSAMVEASVHAVARAGAEIHQVRAKEGSDDSRPATDAVPPISCRRAIWQRIHETARASHSVLGVATLLRGLQPCLHLDYLTNTVYNRTRRSQDETIVRPAMSAVNKFFDLARRPLLEELLDIADSDTSRISLFLDAAGSPRVVEVLLQAILAPADDLHNASISIVRNAFDVVSRADCFRVLLQNAPNDSMRGLRASMAAFNKSGRILLGPIANASRLARCLTDLIDLLCDPATGMLRDQKWIAGHKMRPYIRSLWQAMCATVELIYSETVSWSAFHDNQNMTAWMRDAVLLGDALVDVVRDFEAVVQGSDAAKTTGKAPDEHQQSLDTQLVPIFGGIWPWIRLNDKDLLALVKALLMKLIDRFVRSGVALPKQSISRMIRYATSNKGSTMLSLAETKGFCIALSRHPAHRDAFKDVAGVGVAPASKKAQAEWWREHISEPDAKPKKVNVIELDDDEPATAPSAKPKASTSLPKASVMGKPQTGKMAASASMPFGKLPSSSALPSKAKKPNLPGPKMPAKPRPAQQMNYSHDAIRKRRDQLQSDSDEEVIAGGGLDGLTDVQGSPGKATRVMREMAQQKRQIRQLDVLDATEFGTGGRQTQDRAAADAVARMRIAPDYTALHRSILQWSYQQDASVPPLKPPRAGQIPAQFDTPSDYIETFEPLLILETWQQLMRAKDDLRNAADNPPISCSIVGRQSVDDFVDVFLVISAGNIPERGALTEADLTVLRSGSATVLAKVQSISRKREQMDVTVRCHFGKDTTGASYALSTRSDLELLRLFSLSTTHREYAALTHMPYLALARDVLRPRLRPMGRPDAQHVRQIMEAQRLNEPQAEAVLGVLRTPGFSLIQGPPGTGKTSTILGLVGAFMSEKKSAEASAHLMLCAPSNAAVDELVKRLKDGVRRSDGKLIIPRVVRVGAESAINLNVRDVFIDELVEARLGSDNDAAGKSRSAAAISKIRSDIEGFKQQRDAKQIEKSTVGKNTSLLAQLDLEIRDIRRKIADLGASLEAEKDKQTQSSRAADAERRRTRQEILTSADVICSTLSGTGHDYIAQLTFPFETVIIDEAAQSVELSSLIPLKYGCKRCIMVGDPNQLPPTVLSRSATDAGYDQSLFVRIMRQNRDIVHLLSIQYRMHPQISAFPSHEFYEGRLRDGSDMVAKTEQPWHSKALYSPYCFMHVKNGFEEQGASHSIMNREEAGVAVALYDGLRKAFPDVDLDFRVGVITTYRAQLIELRKQFRQRFGPQISQTIDFNTVDGFQGQEKDIIILSCVRGSPNDTKGSIGFLSDFRRMNVALTRARSSLFILGNASALEKNERWGNLIKDARERGCYREVDRNTFSTASASLAASASRKVSKRKSASSQEKKDPAPVDLLVPKEASKSRPLSSPKNTKRKMSAASLVEESAKPISPKRSRPSLSSNASAAAVEVPSAAGALPLPAPAPSTAAAPRPKPTRPGAAPSLFMPKKPAARKSGL